MVEEVIRAKIVIDTSDIGGAMGGVAGGAGAAGGGGLSGAMGGVAGALKKMALPLLALGEMTKILKGIWNTLKESSMQLQVTAGLFKKSVQLFIRPFGDFLAALLRPLAIALLKLSLKWLQITRPPIEAAKEVIEGGGSFGLAALTGIITGLNEIITAGLGWLWDQISPSWESFKESLGNLKEAVTEKLSEVWDGLKESLSELWDDAKTLLVEKYDTMITWLTDLSTKALEFKETLVDLKDSLLTKLDGVRDAITNAISNLKGIMNSIKNKLKTKIGGVIGGVRSALGLDDFISRPGQSPVSFNAQDTIIGVKDPARLGGGGGITINVNALDASSINTATLNKIANAVQQGMRGGLMGSSSQSWGG